MLCGLRENVCFLRIFCLLLCLQKMSNCWPCVCVVWQCMHGVWASMGHAVVPYFYTYQRLLFHVIVTVFGHRIRLQHSPCPAWRIEPLGYFARWLHWFIQGEGRHGHREGAMHTKSLLFLKKRQWVNLKDSESTRPHHSHALYTVVFAQACTPRINTHAICIHTLYTRVQYKHSRTNLLTEG